MLSSDASRAPRTHPFAYTPEPDPAPANGPMALGLHGTAICGPALTRALARGRTAPARAWRCAQHATRCIDAACTTAAGGARGRTAPAHARRRACLTACLLPVPARASWPPAARMGGQHPPTRCAARAYDRTAHHICIASHSIIAVAMHAHWRRARAWMDGAVSRILPLRIRTESAPPSSMDQHARYISYHHVPDAHWTGRPPESYIPALTVYNYCTLRSRDVEECRWIPRVY